MVAHKEHLLWGLLKCEVCPYIQLFLLSRTTDVKTTALIHQEPLGCTACGLTEQVGFKAVAMACVLTLFIMPRVSSH